MPNSACKGGHQQDLQELVPGIPAALTAATIAALLASAPPMTARAGPAGEETGAAELHAEQITRASARRLQVGGVHSIAGVGDWAVGNGSVCAAISDLSRAGRFSERGGALVDLGHCGRSDDQFVVLQPMLNLRRGASPPFSELRAEVDSERGEARIAARGEADGLLFERRFTLDRQRPERMRIETRVERKARGARFSAWGDLVMHPEASLRPFTANTTRPELSSGFVHPASEGMSVRSRLAGVVPADLHVLVGEDSLAPGIAYGVQLARAERMRADGSRQELPRFSMASEHFGMLNVLARPPWFGAGSDVGVLQLAQAAFLNLGVGDVLETELVVTVGRRADVAAITDRIHGEAPLVRGRVDDPQARVHVDTSDGHPFTQVRPAPDGRFAFRAPSGRYALRIAAPGGRERHLPVLVSETGAELGSIALRAPARVRLPAIGPARIVFVGQGASPDPVIGDDLLGVRVGAARPPSAMRTSSVSLAGLPDDPRSLPLAPGRYRAIATRGPEYGTSEATFELAPGATHALVLDAPQRELESPGWIAADLHVHSAASFDSGLPVAERVRSFAAQGGEVLVASEHDRVFDIGPTVRALGLETQIATVVGLESTSVLNSEAAPHTFGHANVFPMPERPWLFRGGAPTSQGVRLRSVIAEARSLPGERLVQLNHPRRGDGRSGDGALLTHLSVAGRPFEPQRPLSSLPNRALIERDPISGLRDLDFDAIELMNGTSGPTRPYYQRVRADWFSLLLQGERRTATANSDSHRLARPVALPRTYVALPDDRPAAFDASAFVRALRAGRAFGTTGPLIDVDLDGAGMGQRFTGREAVLRVRVRAAGWAAADRARAYVNGSLVGEERLRAGEARWRLDFARDSFVTVEVEGVPNPTFEALLPGATPFAFSNPIFVDADADGRWQAPGLPRIAPRTIRRPLALHSHAPPS